MYLDCHHNEVGLLPKKFDYRTDRQTYGQTDAGQSDPYVPQSLTTGHTDAGQSDPYVPLCFTGNTKTDYIQ